ncbi:ABC transporter permease [Nonomuraea angiospora]|uniref:ABC-2 type transport system permease protein n=1 Tax=Nonomuraea angiospora TaxID=46172 RepID=A0ABR9MFK5_9ACTN|nr:ABC transporter permease [Nonomuraea angiospora]MBE1591696.1 ABC-2 type transport system permease protein [Nonomuraea angiospora]
MTAYTLAHFRLTQMLFWRTPVSVGVALFFPVVFGGLMPLMLPGGTRDGAPVDVAIMTGVIVMGIANLGFMTLVESFVVRRQLLILKRLRGTELPDLAIFGGEILTVLSIGLLQLVLIVGLARVMHGVELPANPALLVVTVLLGLAVFAAMAVAVSGRIPAQGSTVVVSLPFLLLAIGLSGFAYPVSAFPGWLRIVSSFLPFGRVAEGVSTAYLGRDYVGHAGAGVPQKVGVLEGFLVMWPGWLVLAAWLVLSLLAAKRWFKWEPRRG